MDTAIISAVLPMLIKGFWVTMEIAVVGILLGFLLGAVSGYALQGKCRVARTVAGVYIWLIRHADRRAGPLHLLRRAGHPLAP